MRGRRRKQPSENNDDNSRSPKQRRVQREEQNPTPDPDEEQQENGETTGHSTIDLYSEELLRKAIPERPALKMSTDPDAPRLIITKIDVDNFKSYYGKQTLGPFHKNFTSILGPNGSGKSNVIDSLLFVFGFRANKVRSKKIAHLIHNSSAHPNVNSCTVVVHFAKIIDKGTVHEIQKNSEFNISRKADKRGTSVYSINGRHSTTNDVRETLKSNGIDLDHNRFLILQGEVEQISLMKPKRSERSDEDGMLEYLEDIIGSSRLKEPIEQFKKRLDLFENEESMVQKRLKLAETEVSSLVEPVRNVLRLMRIENAITSCKNKLYSIDKLNHTTKSAEARRKVDQLREQFVETEENLKKCTVEIDKKKKAKAKATERESELKEKLDDVEKKKDDAEREKQRNTQEIEQIQKRQTKKEAETKKERKKLEEALEAPKKAETAIRDHQEAIESLKKEIAKTETLLNDLRGKEREANAENRKELEEIMPQITALNTEEQQCDSNILTTTDRLERAQASANDPQHQLKIAEDRASALATELENSEQQLEESRTRMPALMNKIREQDGFVQTSRARENELIERSTALQRELSSNKAESTTIMSNNAALNGLMAEKESKRIEGILGRLGDLGGIDPHYDVAISTCCPQLNNVLVDTVETAQKCIDFLKTNNLSRVTFIALDKQDPRKYKEKISTPENAVRLFDMINVPDEKVKPAFYSVLRDTLFAETIDVATRISNFGGKRWRVVTAKGEVIEPSGTMTGGGRREIKGLMGKQARVDNSQTNNEQDWRRMEQEIKEMRIELNELRPQLSKTMDQVRRDRDNYAQLESEMRTLTQNIPKLKKQIVNAEKEVEKARNVVQTTVFNDDAINALKKEVEKFTKDKEDVCRRALSLRQLKDNLDSRIKQIEDKILSRSRETLKDFKNDLKNAEKECKEEKLVLKNSSTTIERIKRNIEKCEQATKNSHDELLKAHANIGVAEKKLETFKNQRKEHEESLQKAVAEMQQASDDYENLSKQKTDLQKILDEGSVGLRQAEREMNESIEKLREVEEEIGKLALLTARQEIVLPERGAPQNDTSVIEEQTQSVNQAPQNDTSVIEEQSRNDTSATDEHSQDNMSATEEQSQSGDGEEETQEQTAREAEEEVEQQMEDLPNATSVTSIDGEITLNPSHDVGTLPVYTPEQIQEFNLAEIKKQMDKFVKIKSRSKGQMNLTLLDEYAEKSKRRAEVASEMEKLKAIFGKHRKKYMELTQLRNDEFNEGFQEICLATQEIYQMITLGGDAMLEKVNAMDTFNEGIIFQVRPPKKTWKQITNLSGGEKTLASLALVFGLHNYRPTPLYVMDEIDAALDYRNVSIISTYLKERTKNAQFIIISLRNNMFENGDRLLGIYKVNDCTQNLVYDCLDMNDSDSSDEDEN